MIRASRTTRGTALAAVLVLAAACGGDDDAAAGPSGENGSADAAGDTDGDDADDGASSDASGDDDAPPVVSGEPATMLADELHPLDLPEPGTAVVTLAGETYVFEELNTCGINEFSEGRGSFSAIGNAQLADGSGTRFEISRTVIEVDAWSAGDWHERDFLQMTVEQEPGGGMFSNSIHDVHRVEPGDPVSGDGDVMPVIRVVDDGGVLAATAVAELSFPPFVGDIDRAGEGIAEFAVVCD